jgi:dihydroorotate dehydrogenase electron transfer subunit
MIQSLCPVVSVHPVAPQTFVLTLQSPELVSVARPGQFINIKINDLGFPLLRRPFSIYHVEETHIQIIFNVTGVGTRELSLKRPGDYLDILGPLGCSFTTEGEFGTALLVAGGLGVAPLPMITSFLLKSKKPIGTFLGVRTGDQLVTTHLMNVRSATDDGSVGYHGTVVDLLRSELQTKKYLEPKIFACGPNPMLKSLSLLAEEFNVPCEVSLESVMACGIGICQGCPVERVGNEKKYSLICKEGTVFDAREIRIA